MICSALLAVDGSLNALLQLSLFLQKPPIKCQVEYEPKGVCVHRNIFSGCVHASDSRLWVLTIWVHNLELDFPIYHQRVHILYVYGLVKFYHPKLENPFLTGVSLYAESLSC